MDRLVKEKMRIKHYIRYMDDGVLVHESSFMRLCARAKEPGSFSAEASAGKTHAVGDFGRESFQSVGSG